jgi:ABC-2 type transport system ATP-binding protein
MLNVDHISKTYKGGITAVDDVSFSVQPGTVVGILGPNGAGKTTTIRMILNILKPDSGTITFNGEPVGEHTKRHIGYLPEERGLYKKSTIANTLNYFAALKSPERFTQREMSAWLERFDLQGMEGRKIEELSKGNQQKVQFIASVLHNPDLLILDEPFSGLDPVNQLKFKDVVLSLRDAGKAIIFCTHQLESAEKICDEILLYNKGKAVLRGTVDDVKSRFGSNTVRVEFEGDSQAIASVLQNLGFVTDVEMFPHYAEFRLAPNAPNTAINHILAELLPHATLHKIEKMQPSLLSIFVDVVGKGNIPQEFLTEDS